MVGGSQRARADLIALTGDLVEREACLDWIPDTLGRLRAAAACTTCSATTTCASITSRLMQRAQRPGPDPRRRHLARSRRPRHADRDRRQRAALVRSRAANSPACRPATTSGLPLRILLAHAPDQFAWARRHDFDLILAGHNHGGQIRLPLLGAILAPSLSGVRYAGGTFRRDNTVLHVSRGTGGLTPFRWNCPPEIALLVLRSEPRRLAI